MPDLALDFGNALGKWHRPATSGYGFYRHAIAQLQESEWRKVVRRGSPPLGLIKVNGTPYAVGDAARRYTTTDRPHGAARYHKDYYGVGLAFALVEAFGASQKNVFLIASHAPRDVDYSDALEQSALGQYEVECEQGTLKFSVTEVYTYDEPIGGYSHFVLTETGQPKQRNPLLTSSSLVIDVGGYTVDVAAIDPGGVIDVLSLRSTVTGGLNLIDQFTSAMRANNRTLFQDAGELDIRRIESGILTGKYKYGNRFIDCKDEATEAINALVYDVRQAISAAGGYGNFDKNLVTGGFGALIYEALEAAIPGADFMMAENRDRMKYANVFGGPKIVALLRKEGVL